MYLEDDHLSSIAQFLWLPCQCKQLFLARLNGKFNKIHVETFVEWKPGKQIM